MKWMIDEVDERNLSRAGAGAGVDVEGWFRLGQDGRPRLLRSGRSVAFR
jgi:hypothetical protein